MTQNQSGIPASESDRTVFDPTRQKHVNSGPEEGVRQTLIAFLTSKMNVPTGLISVEKAIGGSEESLRADIVVYSRVGDPWMIIECKAPGVSINQATFDQIGRYNRYVAAPYLLISNGTDHYCFNQDRASGRLSFLSSVPQFPDAGEASSENE